MKSTDSTIASLDLDPWVEKFPSDAYNHASDLLDPRTLRLKCSVSLCHCKQNLELSLCVLRGAICLSRHFDFAVLVLIRPSCVGVDCTSSSGAAIQNVVVLDLLSCSVRFGGAGGHNLSDMLVSVFGCL